MRLRSYIALISALLIFIIIVILPAQTRRILDRGFQELATSEINRANAIVQAVIKSKRDNLTSFKQLIAANEEIAKSVREKRLHSELKDLQQLGHFDFVDFIFPDGTSAYGNEKRFGNGTHADETLDADRLSVVPVDGKILLLSFCTKKKKELGMLVLGYELTGPLEKRLSELTGAKIKFMTSEADGKNVTQPPITADDASVFEVSRFPLRTLIMQISLDRSVFGNIDARLRNSLLYSGGISLFILLCLLYLLFEIGFVRRFKKIISSIKKATNEMQTGAIPEVKFLQSPITELKSLSSAFSQFSKSIKSYDARVKEQAAISARIENQAALATLAQQVAHDIRSPLAALEMFVDTYDQLPEEPRKMMKGCVSRTLDVANTLLDKFKAETPNLEQDEADILNVPREVYLLSSLIEPIVSEKRIQYRKKTGVQIRTQFNTESYGLFVLLSALRFKRILSNIIDNAVEAIDGKGEVMVRLSPIGADRVSIVVEDNGSGIAPDLLPKLGTRGTTFGKTTGSGLGLHFAKSVIESVGGQFNISSELGKGTKVEGVLARAAAPDWFVQELAIAPGKQIVVLDDDPSIHHLWNERFRTAGAANYGISLLHFNNGSELIAHHDTSTGLDSIALYLCDYELVGPKQKGLNGLDVIEELCIADKAVLVTTHFDSEAILKRSNKLGIRLLPKLLARLVPISFSETNVSAKKLV